MAAKKTDAVLAKIQALLARAADDGASEEERRTSAAIAAKMMREHGVIIGREAPTSAPAPSSAPATPTRVHVETVIDGVRTVVDVASQGLGFDVFAFAQNLLRERLQGAMQDALAVPKPKRRAAKRRATDSRRSR